MPGERTLRVRINTRGIGLVDHRGPRGTWYSLPTEHHEHYFLVDARGATAPHESLDLYPGETITWIDIDALRTTAIWPRRLAWRIAYWYRAGWPARPAEEHPA
ncbi:hypothetical protein ABH926_006378 [Catenulispora sp. GP43]|uniref:hypothetical protein n=1 Tax=Catenulispora sp. GP43 TaxID=3156263 RepID=UPI0035199E15